MTIMVLMTFSPMGSILTVFVAVLAVAGFSRPSQPAPDVEQRIQDLTLKVRHPWKARAQSVKRWMGVE